jgi:hypothetical protein
VLELYIDGPEDPPPSQGRHRLSRNGARWAVAGALALVLVVVGVINRGRHADQVLAEPPVRPIPVHAPADYPVKMQGTAVLVAGDGAQIYAVTSDPSQIVRIEAQAPNNPLILASAGVSPRAFQFFVDSDTAYLWSLERTGDQTTDVVEYDPISLTEIKRRTLAMFVSQAVAVDGVLFLATSQGLYRYDGETGALRRLLPGDAVAIVQDPVHQRVIVAQALVDGTMLYGLDEDSTRVESRSWIGVLDVTMAAVNEDLWIAGTAGNNQPALVHLPTSWLSPAEASPDPTGSSTTVWPGEEVLWLQDGLHLSCLAAGTGQVLAVASDLIGPVVSGLGFGYVVSNGVLHVLDLRGTPCQPG